PASRDHRRASWLRPSRRRGVESDVLVDGVELARQLGEDARQGTIDGETERPRRPIEDVLDGDRQALRPAANRIETILDELEPSLGLPQRLLLNGGVGFAAHPVLVLTGEQIVFRPGDSFLSLAEFAAPVLLLFAEPV